MDQIKFVEDDSLFKTDNITSNFLKAVTTNFTWSILEYFAPYVLFALDLKIKANHYQCVGKVVGLLQTLMWCSDIKKGKYVKSQNLY